MNLYQTLTRAIFLSPKKSLYKSASHSVINSTQFSPRKLEHFPTFNQINTIIDLTRSYECVQLITVTRRTCNTNAHLLTFMTRTSYYSSDRISKNSIILHYTATSRSTVLTSRTQVFTSKKYSKKMR